MSAASSFNGVSSSNLCCLIGILSWIQNTVNHPFGRFAKGLRTAPIASAAEGEGRSLSSSELENALQRADFLVLARVTTDVESHGDPDVGAHQRLDAGTVSPNETFDHLVVVVSRPFRRIFKKCSRGGA